MEKYKIYHQYKEKIYELPLSSFKSPNKARCGGTCRYSQHSRGRDRIERSKSTRSTQCVHDQLGLHSKILPLKSKPKQANSNKTKTLKKKKVEMQAGN